MIVRQILLRFREYLTRTFGFTVITYLQISLKATQNVWWRKWCRGLRGREAPGEESEEGKDRVSCQVERLASWHPLSSWHFLIENVSGYEDEAENTWEPVENLDCEDKIQEFEKKHKVSLSQHHTKIIISFSYSIMFSYSPPPGERDSRKGRSLYHHILTLIHYHKSINILPLTHESVDLS